MQINDIKKYRSYLPIKAEKEETIKWMIQIIGAEWKNILWFNKFSNNYIVRYRFGNKNITQIYLKNKKWKQLPLSMWIKFTSQDLKCLDDDCWKWIHEERKSLNIKQNKKTTVVSHDDILEI